MAAERAAGLGLPFSPDVNRCPDTRARIQALLDFCDVTEVTAVGEVYKMVDAVIVSTGTLSFEQTVQLVVSFRRSIPLVFVPGVHTNLENEPSYSRILEGVRQLVQAQRPKYKYALMEMIDNMFDCCPLSGLPLLVASTIAQP